MDGWIDPLTPSATTDPLDQCFPFHFPALHAHRKSTKAFVFPEVGK